MERRAAKELLHIKSWFVRVDDILRRGKEAYLADVLLQEAGDSLMMKLGEAANRLSRLGVLPPEGVEWALAIANRNFIIHQYDEINRKQTWLTLSNDLAAWNASLQTLFDDAEMTLSEGGSRAVSAAPNSGGLGPGRGCPRQAGVQPGFEGGHKPATYSPLHDPPRSVDSEADREVSPRKPEEIRDLPSLSVAPDLFQRSQVQILPPLQKSEGPSQ